MASRITKLKPGLSPSHYIEAIRTFVATVASYKAMFVVGDKVLRWVYTRGVEAIYGLRMFSGPVMGEIRRYGFCRAPLNTESQGRASRVRAEFFTPDRFAFWPMRLSRSKGYPGRESGEAILERWDRDSEYLRERGYNVRVVYNQLVQKIQGCKKME